MTDAGNLIDPATIRRFLQIIHDHAGKLAKSVESRGALQLVAIYPNSDPRPVTTQFEIGDVKGMVDVAIAYAESGHNVYFEPRVVRAAIGGHRRGGAEDTIFVFDLVVDNDADRDHASTIAIEASLAVETSPGNSHEHLFLDRPIGPETAAVYGLNLRAATKSCHATGTVGLPYRVPGTPNYPDPAKAARGRVTVPTSIKSYSGKLWTAEELHATFPDVAGSGSLTPVEAWDIDCDLKLMASALAVIPNKPPVDRATWFSVVMALHWASINATSPANAARIKELCFAWANQARGTWGGTNRARIIHGRGTVRLWNWADKSRAPCPKPITIGTLYVIAESEFGWDRLKAEREIEKARAIELSRETQYWTSLSWEEFCVVMGMDPITLKHGLGPDPHYTPKTPQPNKEQPIGDGDGPCAAGLDGDVETLPPPGLDDLDADPDDPGSGATSDPGSERDSNPGSDPGSNPGSDDLDKLNISDDLRHAIRSGRFIPGNPKADHTAWWIVCHLSAAGISAETILCIITDARFRASNHWAKYSRDWIAEQIAIAVQTVKDNPNAGDWPRNKPPPTPKRRQDYDEFCKSYKPAIYAVGNHILRGYVYFLTALAYTGKTLFGVSLMHAVPTGRRDILDIDIEQPGRVAYLMIENPDDTKKRVIAQRYHYGLDSSELKDKITILTEFDFIDPKTAKPVSPLDKAYQECLDDAREKGPLSLVIIDSWQACFVGDSFNDNTEMLKAAKLVRQFTKLPGNPAVVVLAHPVKNAGEDNLVPYGGNAAFNESDGNLTLWKDEKTGVIRFHFFKKIRGSQFTPLYYAVRQIRCPDLVDSKGRKIEVPVLEPADAGLSESREQKQRRNQKSLLVALFDNPTASYRDIEKMSGIPRSNLARFFSYLTKFKLVEQSLDGPGCRLTKKGREEAKKIKTEPF